MIYRVSQVKVPLEYSDADVLKKVSRKVSMPPKLILSCTVSKRSVDARQELSYTLSVLIETEHPIRKNHRDLQLVSTDDDIEYAVPEIGEQSTRPIVIGAGPAGLTAAWILAKAGTNPIILERGDSVEDRSRKINRFRNHGELDEESNVLYGEGGAGLFSDGKLTARSKDNRRVKLFLELLVAHGAPKETLIDAHPHIGTDKLMRIIPSIRKEIIELGGEFRFGTRVDSLVIEDERVTGVKIKDETITSDAVILAIGHSARDMYRQLYSDGITMVPKPFAIGVRVELPQVGINSSQWGCTTSELGSASFRLTRKESSKSRACYSFCMCPGGEVISCGSQPGMVTSNGMSYHNRNLPFGNAAFLVPVMPKDFCPPEELNALSGILYQEKLERDAFEAGGSDYSLPVSCLDDFLHGGEPTHLPKEYSAKRIKAADLTKILPGFITKSLQESLPPMLKKLGNPSWANVTLYGTETRSSAPLQISRDRDSGESLSHCGLFPTGEGAGYAGGIVSSGIDGIKAAEAVLETVYNKR